MEGKMDLSQLIFDYIVENLDLEGSQTELRHSINLWVAARRFRRAKEKKAQQVRHFETPSGVLASYSIFYRPEDNKSFAIGDDIGRGRIISSIQNINGEIVVFFTYNNRPPTLHDRILLRNI